jgi:hypothetical protein
VREREALVVVARLRHHPVVLGRRLAARNEVRSTPLDGETGQDREPDLFGGGETALIDGMLGDPRMDSSAGGCRAAARRGSANHHRRASTASLITVRSSAGGVLWSAPLQEGGIRWVS